MKRNTGKKYPSVSGTTDYQHIRMVKEIFSTITEKYDFLNHLMSLRRDISWRRFAVARMRFSRTHRFLDVATGTCDLAIETALGHPGVYVVGLDFVKEMIDVGQEKIKRRGLSTKVGLLRGDALNIPFPPDQFDAAGMAFGIRNIPDKLQVLKEMARVVVPGGQALILELTAPRRKLLTGLYRLYLNRVLPRLARPFSPNPEAYHYLGDSIANFPTPFEFASLMEQAGLGDVEIHSLTLGITHLYVGYKPMKP